MVMIQIRTHVMLVLIWVQTVCKCVISRQQKVPLARKQYTTSSYLGYIKIDIPWTNLFSSSVVCHLEDVYILAGPITDRVYDPERERALQNAIKREMLESLETSAINKVGM